MESIDGTDQNQVPDPANGSNSAPPPQPQPQPPLSGVQEAANHNGNGRIIPVIRYRDCLKNHAASIGGHAVDGCGEFMPGGEEEEEGTPASLTCAACSCHRNFHRREESDSNGNNHGRGGYAANLYLPPPPPPPRHPIPTIRPSPNHHYIYSSMSAATTSPSPSTPTAPVMMMNFSRDGGATAESSSEDFNLFQSSNIKGETSNSNNKKRFRTIFTNLQKEKMHDFAEKLGWKIQRQDEQQVQRFCNEVGIKRQVLKVWLHNNKQQAIKKKEL